MIDEWSDLMTDTWVCTHNTESVITVKHGCVSFSYFSFYFFPLIILQFYSIWYLFNMGVVWSHLFISETVDAPFIVWLCYFTHEPIMFQVNFEFHVLLSCLRLFWWWDPFLFLNSTGTGVYNEQRNKSQRRISDGQWFEQMSKMSKNCDHKGRGWNHQ